MKKQHNYVAWITGLLSILLIISIIAFALNQKKDDTNVTPDPNASTPKTTITLGDYTVYRFVDLDFQFIIANLKVTSDKAISLDMAGMKTDKGVLLTQAEPYIKKLLAQGYVLTKQNILYAFQSAEKSMEGNVLIPVADKGATSASLIVSLGDSTSKTIKFDLTKASGTAAMLSYQSTDTITDNQNYSFKIESIESLSNRTLFMTNAMGTDSVDFSSWSKIYALKLKINPLNSVTLNIESSKYLITDSTIETAIMVQSYSVEDYPNFYAKDISTETSGYLYLQIVATTGDYTKVPAVLEIKFKGIDDIVKINIVN